jgi:metallo-beta-lactamase family protein
MCTGGRILHHMKHNLWRPECSVIFVGYAAAGTTGRAIIDGADPVRLYGESVRSRAQIYTINGFSGHAGQKTLLDWLERTGKPENVVLVHGEDHAREALAHAIEEKMGLSSVIPGVGDVIEF